MNKYIELPDGSLFRADQVISINTVTDNGKVFINIRLEDYTIRFHHESDALTPKQFCVNLNRRVVALNKDN